MLNVNLEQLKKEEWVHSFNLLFATDSQHTHNPSAIILQYSQPHIVVSYKGNTTST